MAKEDKELTLTVWELFNIYSVISSQSGRAGQMRVWWRILDALEPPDELKAEWGWVEVDEVGLTLSPDEFDSEHTVTLSEANYDRMVKAIDNFEGWRAGGVAGGGRDRLKSLFEKLGIET